MLGPREVPVGNPSEGDVGTANAGLGLKPRHNLPELVDGPLLRTFARLCLSIFLSLSLSLSFLLLHSFFLSLSLSWSFSLYPSLYPSVYPSLSFVAPSCSHSFSSLLLHRSRYRS